MKTVQKRILISVGVVIAALAVIGLYAVLPFLSMAPVETGVVEGTGIIAVKNAKNNVYLLPCENGYLMIDAGSDADGIQKSLASLSINLEAVSAVFLTHTDYDHVASLGIFPNAIIYLNIAEKQMIDGTTRRNSAMTNSLPVKDAERIMFLTDGESINADGHSITCIAAPGHTPGSMMYLADGKYLFTGDAFKVTNGNISVHPFTMDAETAAKTISTLRPVFDNCSIVFTGHYGYFNADKLKL